MGCQKATDFPKTSQMLRADPQPLRSGETWGTWSQALRYMGRGDRGPLWMSLRFHLSTLLWSFQVQRDWQICADPSQYWVQEYITDLELNSGKVWRLQGSVTSVGQMRRCLTLQFWRPAPLLPHPEACPHSRFLFDFRLAYVSRFVFAPCFCFEMLLCNERFVDISWFPLHPFPFPFSSSQIASTNQWVWLAFWGRNWTTYMKQQMLIE